MYLWRAMRNAIGYQAHAGLVLRSNAPKARSRGTPWARRSRH